MMRYEGNTAMKFRAKAVVSPRRPSRTRHTMLSRHDGVWLG